MYMTRHTHCNQIATVAMVDTAKKYKIIMHFSTSILNPGFGIFLQDIDSVLATI